jgi:hypothetical protein
MSRYLIRRIEESSAITLRTHTQIEALEGGVRLQRVCWRSAHAAAREVRDIRHVFSVTGADANTGWLAGCLALDERRFIKTGADLRPEELEAVQWPLNRRPLPVRDQCAPSVRGRRRAVRQHEARGGRGGRGLGRGPTRPQGAGRMMADLHRASPEKDIDSSNRRHGAAVDDVFAPVNRACPVGHKEGDQFRHFFRAAWSANRDSPE